MICIGKPSECSQRQYSGTAGLSGVECDELCRRSWQSLPGVRSTAVYRHKSYEILIRKLYHVRRKFGGEWVGTFCYSLLSHYENKRIVTGTLWRSSPRLWFWWWPQDGDKGVLFTEGAWTVLFGVQGSKAYRFIADDVTVLYCTVNLVRFLEYRWCFMTYNWCSMTWLMFYDV